MELVGCASLPSWLRAFLYIINTPACLKCYFFFGWHIVIWCTAALYHESTTSQIISLILFSFAGSAGKRSVNALGLGIFLGELNAASLWGVMNNDHMLVTSPWEGRKNTGRNTERQFILCSQSHFRNEEARSELCIDFTSLSVMFCSSLCVSTVTIHQGSTLSEAVFGS